MTEVEKNLACSKCKATLPASSFAIDRSTKRGYKSQCKSCRNKAERAARSGSLRVTHAGLTPQKQLKAIANRNALITLMKKHHDEFERLVRFEMARLEKLDKDPKVAKTWIKADIF